MIQFFRKFMKSGFGVALALIFLGLIALAFAAGDVANTGGFGGGGSGDQIAEIGDERIDASALSQAATAALEDAKAENPRMSMKAFLAAEGLDNVLERLIDRTAIAAFGRSHGIIANERLIGSEISQIPAAKGPDGNFSEAAFRQLLQQRGLSEQRVRDDIAAGLIARQIMVPAAYGASLPRELATRYAALLRERRSGAIGLVPSALFVPRTPPTDAELTAWYAKHRNEFIRPERRVIRYAVFGDDAVREVAAPTEAEIAQRYNANKAQFAATENRRITQLILPTEAAARAIVAEVAGGKRLEAVASAKGLSAASLGSVSKQALAGQSSAAVADAAFAAASGAVSAPAKSGLGWHVMRVDGIDRKAERTLDQVRGEIVQALAIEKRRAALTDFSARIEEEFDGGGNLADTARELGVALQQTAPVTADGQIYGQPGQTAPAILAKVFQTAFAMEGESEPQLAEIEPGKTFLIFDVVEITPSAPAPLTDIRQEAVAEYQLEKGSAAAKAAADKVVAQVKQGKDLATAMGSLGVALPPVDRIDMGRQELVAQGQQVPPPLALMFSMAEGTVKRLAGPRNRGFFVVTLKDIAPGNVAANDPILAAAQRELGQLTGREYSEQLVRAIRAEVGVEKNDAAIRAVRTQLGGGN